MVLTLVIAFLSLIALMIIHEFGHFIIAKKFGVKVEEFGIGYPPKIFGKKFGETVYSLNLIPLGAFVKIKGEEGGIDDYRSFSNLAIWKRALIVLGGVIAFWIASIIIYSAVFAMGADVPVGDQDIAGVSSPVIKIVMVLKDSPAEKAGLKTGDSVVNLKDEAGDVKVDKIADFQSFINKNKGKEINITVNRIGKNFDLKITPRESYPANQGPLGVGLERMATLIKKYPWYRAPLQGAIFCGEITYKSLLGLAGIFGNLFGGKGLPPGAELTGPIGITVYLARAVDYGLGFFLYFIGSISVFMAIFNLFPIPALDGGKLVFLAIEKIKGRPVSVRVEQTITVVFFILLIGLSLFISYFDIGRLVEFIKASLQK